MLRSASMTEGSGAREAGAGQPKGSVEEVAGPASPGRGTCRVVLLISVLALAAAVRLIGVGGYGFQHFDERPYAFEAARLARVPWPTLIGNRRLEVTYAPPLFPVLVSVPYRLFGISDTAAIATSALMGVAGVVLLFLLVRRLLGYWEALAAAGLLAVTEFHIIFSRLALTETTFFALFLGALWAYVGAFERRRWRDFLFAGLWSLGASWAKYSAATMPFIALLYLLLQHRRDWREFGRGLKGWLLSVGVLAAGFVPWVFYIQAKMGLGPFRAHRATYLRVGFAAALHALGFAWQCMAWFVGWPILALAAVGVVLLVVHRDGRFRSAGNLLLAWLVGYGGPLLFYLPYDRLSLPLVPLLIIPAVVALAWLRGAAAGGPLGAHRGRALLWAGALVSLMLLAFAGSLDTLRRRPTGLREAARFVAQAPGESLVIRACQAPLDFYLTELQFPLERFTVLTQANVREVARLAREGAPMLLVADCYLNENPDLKSAVLAAGMRERAAFRNDVFDVIMLGGGFETLRRVREDPEEPSLRLYTHVVVYAPPEQRP
jgi:4-amino-4-deoxy-L-arabinose transferase-like glycosyltransferase